MRNGWGVRGGSQRKDIFQENVNEAEVAKSSRRAFLKETSVLCIKEGLRLLLSYSMNSQRLESAVTPQVPLLPFLLGPFREQMAFSLLQPFFSWVNGIRDASESNSASETQPSCAVVAFFQESEKSKLKNFRLSPPVPQSEEKENFPFDQRGPPQTGGFGGC